jgi:hypothetical protein
VYTPKARFAGTDSFSFTVRDSSSPYPVHAPAATVTVTVPGPVKAKRKVRLLSKVRFARHGRFIVVRARALRSGKLRIKLVKGKRRLGSCSKRARARHAFRCRIELHRHASPRSARAVVSLLVHGKATAVDSYRLPRRLARG